MGEPLVQQIGRRNLLLACAAGGAAVALVSNARLGISRPIEQGELPTVKAFGAVGDGVTDDSPAFRRAADAADTIRIPAGTYRADSSIALKQGQLVAFDAGVVIRAGALMDSAVLDADGVDGVQIIGNGAVIDLNEKTDKAIRISGSKSRPNRRCRVSGISVIGRSLTTDPGTASSAIELTHLDGVVASDIQVDGYAHKNARDAEQGYSVGLFHCINPQLNALRVTNANVGLEIFNCQNVQVSQFTIRDCIDNGVYILSGSTSVTLLQGLIDNCEEGVVIRSDNVTLSNVSITNCTNKGVSLRTGRRGKINFCHFERNRVHIGDDREGERTANLSVRETTFRNAAEAAISLMATTDSEFDGLDVQDSSASYKGGLIRLSNASRCSIRNSRFNNPGKSVPIIIRLSNATADAIIAGNIFVEADTAIELFDIAGRHPKNTQILDNTFLSVNTPVRQSQAVTGTVERPDR
ncbi:right-handed parallel beta-helix repeat-containing protein [Mycolicibacterium baixiangningiae]|uniref:right-handed parallel beta-helix repeat-containing protein n=1 Tax=Mycolicibacterium baixiangningiae TaxID=2761578 RepID=UPI0018D17240|nr:right-handed parallel beta-helix repeat-containing protein [Mycolicibacterium baixiangningiae]